jgi:hypothetical protein
VSSHGATVSVASVAANRTMFTVPLPRRSRAASGAEPLRLLSHAFRGGRHDGSVRATSRLEDADMYARFTILLALLLHGRSLAAQIRASEQAAVEQTIDGTTITLEFYRPMARGRTLFGDRGGVVRSGEAWTPGANWATTIEASRDIWLGGQRLPKGRYGVWLIPRDTGDWTLFLDREVRRFHTMRAKPDSAVMRLAVQPVHGSSLEGLLWYFPFVGGDTAALRLHWGSTMIDVPLRVDPSKPQTLAA